MAEAIGLNLQELFKETIIMRQQTWVTSKQGDIYGNVNYSRDNAQGMFTSETFDQRKRGEQCVESESDFTLIVTKNLCEF